jgi:DNA-binding beta-propeller fold protein YncE
VCETTSRRRKAMMSVPRRVMLLATIALLSCSTAPAPPPATGGQLGTVQSIALPGAGTDGVLMDYIAYDRSQRRVWVPAGNTGRVDVVDAATGHVAAIAGFATAQVERRGMTRTVGPSSATVGEGVVYVGNRADSSLCAIDAVHLTIQTCITLDSAPDGLAYVAATREVWATMPRDRSIAIVAAANGTLQRTATIRLDGQPEGFAVDNGRGCFYTNFEDGNRTVGIDLHTRQVTSNWPAGCGADGPRGLALDRDSNLLLVACTDRVRVLDTGHAGTALGQIIVGDGLDNIDYLAPRHELYAAAARAATLTIARLDARGELTLVASVPTAAGARNAVVTDDGSAFVTDSAEGKLLAVGPAASAAERPR